MLKTKNSKRRYRAYASSETDWYEIITETCLFTTFARCLLIVVVILSACCLLLADTCHLFPVTCHLLKNSVMVSKNRTNFIIMVSRAPRAEKIPVLSSAFAAVTDIACGSVVAVLSSYFL